MTFSHSSGAAQTTCSFETLLETLDHKRSRARAHNDGAPDAKLSYRAAPDGSVTMGTDPLSGQVVLIVQNGDQSWEIALPPRVARFATTDPLNSLAAAKRVAEAAFGAYQANCPE